jgi:hypothetical protein
MLLNLLRCWMGDHYRTPAAVVLSKHKLIYEQKLIHPARMGHEEGGNTAQIRTVLTRKT